MTENDDNPVYHWDDIVGWIGNFLAAVGIMFAALLVWLYQTGFFDWLFTKLRG